MRPALEKVCTKYGSVRLRKNRKKTSLSGTETDQLYEETEASVSGAEGITIHLLNNTTFIKNIINIINIKK